MAWRKRYVISGWRFQADDLRLLRQRQVLAQPGPLAFHRVIVVQHAEMEVLPDHAGHLDRQLLGRSQPVDAAGNYPVQRVGQTPSAPIGECGRHPAPSRFDLQQSSVAQRVDQLLDEQRIALSHLMDRGRATLPARRQRRGIGRASARYRQP